MVKCCLGSELKGLRLKCSHYRPSSQRKHWILVLLVMLVLTFLWALLLCPLNNVSGVCVRVSSVGNGGSAGIAACFHLTVKGMENGGLCNSCYNLDFIARIPPFQQIHSEAHVSMVTHEFSGALLLCLPPSALSVIAVNVRPVRRPLCSAFGSEHVRVYFCLALLYQSNYIKVCSVAHLSVCACVCCFSFLI